MKYWFELDIDKAEELIKNLNDAVEEADRQLSEEEVANAKETIMKAIRVLYYKDREVKNKERQRYGYDSIGDTAAGAWAKAPGRPTRNRHSGYS